MPINFLDLSSRPINKPTERAHLKPAQVLDIKRRLIAGGQTQHEIAKEFGVRQTTISMIKSGQTHRDVLCGDDVSVETAITCKCCGDVFQAHRSDSQFCSDCRPISASYNRQRRNAAHKNILFLLTFEEWWEIWRPYWDLRTGRGKLLMVRTRHQEPMVAGNVQIIDTTALITQARKFSDQRSNAASRNIPFLLTFDEWWSIWQASGHWHERGRGRGKYVMARFGDLGPYAVGNVKIILWEENRAELKVSGRKLSLETRAKMSASRRKRGLKHSAETKAKMSASRRLNIMTSNMKPIIDELEKL